MPHVAVQYTSRQVKESCFAKQAELASHLVHWPHFIAELSSE